MVDYIKRDAVIALIEDKQRELCPVGRYSRNAVYGSDRDAFDAWQEILDSIEAMPAYDFADDDFGCILNCAVRYVLGRQTYMPKLVVDYITPLIPYLDGKTLSCFDKDIIEQGCHGGYGHQDIDRPVWMQFHEAVIQEIGRRDISLKQKF